MDTKSQNAIQRARISRGWTQEALAERIGYSSDAVRSWESGSRIASLDALDKLQLVLDAAWLPGIYLRECSSILSDLLPEFAVGRPLSEAAAAYISVIFELIDNKVDRQLLRLVADGHIDDLERPVYDQIMEIAGRANKAYYEMLYARR